MFRRLIWLEVAGLLLALVLLEMGAVLLELRTAIIADWFVSLAPLIWINVSAVSLYAFFRQLYGTKSGVHVPDGRSTSRVWKFLRPDFPSLYAMIDRPMFGRLWFLVSLAYLVVYMVLQGMLVIDLPGRLPPVLTILVSPVGYGPGFAWSVTPSLGISLRPYAVAAVIALSLFSGFVLSLFILLVGDRRAAAHTLPGPLAGLGVMCPACLATPTTGLVLAYVAPVATLVGLAAVPVFSITLAVSTTLLIVSLVLLWISASWLSRIRAR